VEDEDVCLFGINPINKSKAQKEARLEWWREARFGMFIHWGLYAIPAGQWNDKTGYADWIMTLNKKIIIRVSND